VFSKLLINFLRIRFICNKYTARPAGFAR